jgi:curved DNA-binding protein CbpA
MSSGSKQGSERHRFTTHYEILGVAKDATATEIRHAYFRLKSVYTSGNQALYSLINDEELTATIKRIEQSYDILHNATRRQAYDREIGASGDIEGPSVQVVANQQIPGSATMTAAPHAGFAPRRATEMGVSAPDKYSPGETGGSHMKIHRIRGVAVAAGNPEIRKIVDAMIAAVQTVDGKFLRSLRDAVGVDEQEMQVNTKIPLSFLDSLENDRIGDMPQATYAKGFVKSYLRYLGVNEAKDLIEAYFQRGNTCDRQPTP